MDQAMPKHEDTLTPGIDVLTSQLMEIATEDWQEAQLSFKRVDDTLLIDWVRVRKP